MGHDLILKLQVTRHTYRIQLKVISFSNKQYIQNISDLALFSSYL